jgi:hypothetical protein
MPGIASQKPTNALTIVPGLKTYGPDIGACTLKTRRQNSCMNILSAVTQIVEITKDWNRQIDWRR